jgi:hypothetical protein
MRFRLWPRREPVEATPPEEVPSPPSPEPAPVASGAAQRLEPEEPAEILAEPPDEPEQAPAALTLTIEEAKATIKEAGGDVIQVGFLASAYRRQLEDDPESAETAAARKRLGDLVAKRLKDRGLLAPDGSVELRDEAAS